MIKFPNGQKFEPQAKSKKQKELKNYSSANRGMSLEEDINITNEFYKQNNICLVSKRPTPINVVRVDYSRGARIVDAYFEKQSTTDYNGVYKGRYLDFEAKSTKSKTSFPLANISDHQISHLSNVILHGGIAFFIIQFEALNEVYFLDAKFMIKFVNSENRKSIPYKTIKSEGILIKKAYIPRLDYVTALEQNFLKN